MWLRRALAGLFASSGLMLALLLPASSGGDRPLLAQAASCGAGNGNKCKETTSCVWYVFGRICTTYYYYYPGGTSGPAGEGAVLPERTDPES